MWEPTIGGTIISRGWDVELNGALVNFHKGGLW